MTTVGVRELKNRLSYYLELVRKGETITVTTRGRRVATILPLPESQQEERLMRLVREGKASWNGGKPAGASRRVRWPGKPLSEIVIQDRD